MRRSLFFLLLVAAWVVCVRAQQATVYPRIETGAHSALVYRIDVDAGERFLFSASDDKTVRVWDLRSGSLLRILRPPIGMGNEGRLYAVASTPDGSSVAAGGFTGRDSSDNPIYIFDRQSGAIRKTLSGFPNVTFHLAYSKDGRYLAAALGDESGIRIYRTGDYGEVVRDTQYNHSCFWVEFDNSGRMVTASYDGFIRLYDSNFHLLAKKQTPGGKQPYSARFSPNGRFISVGFADTNAVDVLSADDLSLLYAVPTSPDQQGKSLQSTVFSADGQLLCAGGRGNYNSAGVRLIFCWENLGKGKSSSYPAASSTISGLHALRDGAIAFASADGSVGVVDRTGTLRWRAAPDNLDVRGNTLRVSSDGNRIQTNADDFDGTRWAYHTIGFSLSDETLTVDGPSNSLLSLPITNSLAIEGWKSGDHPTLNGKPLALDSYEAPTSLAIAQGADSFVLGTEWNLRKFDAQGKELWNWPMPGVAWQVNITDDRRYVIVALGDGTIRWYSFNSGEELLALFIDRNLKSWVAWNPDGFFTFKGGGDSLIGYQINHGPGQAGEFVKVDQMREVFYRADLVDRILAPDGAARILAARNQAGGNVSQTLSAGLPPQIELVSAPHADVSDSYQLQFKVKNMGGGVGRIVYRIDGAEIEGRSVDIAGTARDTINRSIPIGGGQHTLTVAAYSANGKVLGQPTTIRLTGRQPAPGSTTSLYVIAAGISHYSDHSLWDGVRFASADADLVAARFREQEGKGLYQKVTAVPLEDSRATTKGIQDAVAQIAGKVRPGDTFILYLAGHGIVVDGEYYFIPWEAEYSNRQAMLNKSLNREAIQAMLKAIPTNKSVLILDTCNSGAFVEGRDAASEKAAIEKVATMSGHAVLAASNSDEMAMDGYQGHGVFTYALLEGLGRADSDAQGEILITRLAEYVQLRVPAITMEKWHYRQTPLSETKGDPFPIARKAAN